MTEEHPMTTPADVLAFWREAGMAKWFNGGAAFDADCRTRFLDAHHAAARGECEAWLDDADGALAALILLDQIPRNVYRGSGHAFATDGLARRYALQAVEAGLARGCRQTCACSPTCRSNTPRTSPSRTARWR